MGLFRDMFRSTKDIERENQFERLFFKAMFMSAGAEGDADRQFALKKRFGRDATAYARSCGKKIKAAERAFLKSVSSGHGIDPEKGLNNIHEMDSDYLRKLVDSLLNQ